ncbi:MAG: hypothetical protein LUC16_01145 [Coprobacillus sp.]|nr:hypothetical protein [Coprobacillus sp.]
MNIKKKILIPIILTSLTLSGCSGSYIDEYSRLICESLDFNISDEWFSENKDAYREEAEFVYRIQVEDVSVDYFQITRNGFTLDGDALYLIHTPFSCTVEEVIREDTSVSYDRDEFSDWTWPSEGDLITIFLLGQWTENSGCYYKYDLEERMSTGFEYYVYLDYWEGYTLSDSDNKGNGFVTCFPSLGIDFISGINEGISSSEENSEENEEETGLENEDTSTENSD